MLLFECYACRANVILVSRPYYYYCLYYSYSSRTTSPATRTQVRYEPLLAAPKLFWTNTTPNCRALKGRLIASRCETLREG